MSHFTVMVIGDDVDGQLAPYQENNMGDCPKEYLDFIDCTEEVQVKWDMLEVPVTNGKDLVKNGQEDIRIYWRKVEGKPKEEIIYHSMKEFAKEYFGYHKHGDRYGYYENPNAKWDWYQIGGRWQGMLKLKNGASGRNGQASLLMKDHEYKDGYVDQALKRDIDFEGMYEEGHKHAINRYKKVKAVIGEDPDHLTWEQIKEKNKGLEMEVLRDKFWNQPMCKKWKAKNREMLELAGWSSSPDEFLMPMDKYAEMEGASSLMTYAYLYKGKWHAKGDMGWWGMSYDEKDPGVFEKEFMDFLRKLPDNTLITIVDCHI